jgi:hypothetical protein
MPAHLLESMLAATLGSASSMAGPAATSQVAQQLLPLLMQAVAMMQAQAPPALATSTPDIAFQTPPTRGRLCGSPTLDSLCEAALEADLQESERKEDPREAPEDRNAETTQDGKGDGSEERQNSKENGDGKAEPPQDAVKVETDDNKQDEKEAHARYMRFWRSITINKRKPAPPCVLTEVAKLTKEEGGKAPRGVLTFLFEDWMQSKECWSGLPTQPRMRRLCASVCYLLRGGAAH